MRCSSLPALAALFALAACNDAAHRDPAVDKAWVRLPAVAGLPGAAYFTLHGGKAGATLAAVKSPEADRVELHESMASAGGMMRMTPLDRVAVPAGGTVAFAPGGKHAMLYGIKPAVKAGGTMTLTFTFAGKPPVAVDAEVVAAGDMAPE